MSSFQRWCRQAHTVLRSSGLKLPYGHVQQMLARGLGHPSLFSFQKADSHALESAAFALLDEPEMLKRAHSLGIALTPEISNDICLDLRETRDAPTLIRARYFEHLAGQAFPADDHPAVDALAQEIAKTLPDHAVEGAQVHRAEPLGDFQEGESWKWNVHGYVFALHDGDDYEVPFTGLMVFPSIGLRLLSSPDIHDVRPSGPPEPWDPGITDFAYISEIDS